MKLTPVVPKKWPASCGSNPNDCSIAVLDVIVDVLDLRRWDPQGTLGARNTRRYFAGERVSPEAEAAVHRAVAEALVASDLIPASLTLVPLS